MRKFIISSYKYPGCYTVAVESDGVVVKSDTHMNAKLLHDTEGFESDVNGILEHLGAAISEKLDYASPGMPDGCIFEAHLGIDEDEDECIEFFYLAKSSLRDILSATL